ncbi:anthranilate phosphoribosyltransferase [Telmatospirillum siberiense]|uniref:Anthranilate phosphoribosyltransferase n=1 Tax=Telmatospirillum siberiense TaxID=382514 RepID=A0A2N3PZD6_9PROT|nr:anthranilate phosphoribosyltransferase [Telmatospirillum siberiense]PKU25770.1 anthranilate phosphoribosyltransferase [Telmatospirillum siberiense]
MSSNDLMKSLLARVANSERLSEEEATAAFDVIMSGDATPAQIGGFLMALRVRGETVPEITGATRAMRSKAATLEAPPGAIDTCGTGGDASGTYNISTAAALVVAACGVPVAKHGNRALSSKSGSADVLAALGVKIDADLSLVRESLWQNGIGFLMAPRHHSAMRHVAGPRVELGTRTIFNLLGPLSNPAGTKRQVVGVFAERWVEPLAEVLGRLGAERAWVVHGTDGLDELTTTGPSHVAEWNEGKLRRFEITPADAGLPTARPEDLKGGDAEVNAAALTRLIAGEQGPYRDIVLLNAAAALVVAGKAPDLTTGVSEAARAIDEGHVRMTLDRLIAISNREVVS